MKNCTDVEQSKKLIKLGIDVNTADMMWDDWSLIDEGWKLSVGYYPEIEKDYGRKCYPAWSLAALLEYLRQKDCFPEITSTGECFLMDINFYDDEEGKVVHPLHFIRTEGKTLVDAAVEMIYKLKEKDLI